MAWPKRRPRHRRGPGSPVIIIGISYEGIDQHDIITESGIAFEAPEDIRTDGGASFSVPNIYLAADISGGGGEESAAPPSPLGFAGQPLTGRPKPPPSQTDTEFVPFEDRWRIPLPRWNRYPERPGEYPYTEGHWWDPYDQNVIKGDYPIIGNEIFFVFTGLSDTLFETRSE